MAEKTKTPAPAVRTGVYGLYNSNLSVDYFLLSRCFDQSGQRTIRFFRHQRELNPKTSR